MKKNGVSMKWDGLDKSFAKALIETRQTKALMEDVGEALVSSTLKRFDDEKSPEGKAWKKSKRAIAESGKTLNNKGNLKNSIGMKAETDKITIGSKDIGTTSKYARIHQKGGKAGRGRNVTMPARPFLGLSKMDKKEIEHKLLSFMGNCFKG